MALGRSTMTVGSHGAEEQAMFPLASSTVLNAASGRFLTASSGNYALSTGSSTQIDGWTDRCFSVTHDGTQGTTPFTSSATAGASVVPGTFEIHEEKFAKWIPAKTGITLATTDVGKLCDLDVTSNIQGVDPSTTTRTHVKIIEVDLVNNYAKVYAVK